MLFERVNLSSVLSTKDPPPINKMGQGNPFTEVTRKVTEGSSPWQYCIVIGCVVGLAAKEAYSLFQKMEDLLNSHYIEAKHRE